jgi:hypothetical protein
MLLPKAENRLRQAQKFEFGASRGEGATRSIAWNPWVT